MVHFPHRPDPIFPCIVRHAGQVVLKLVVEADTFALFPDIRQQCSPVRGVT